MQDIVALQARDLSRGKIRHNSPKDHDQSRACAACPRSRRVDQQPALSAADPDLAVLGRNIVLARHVGDHVPPITMSCIRWFATFLILLPFAWPHIKHDWPVLRAHLPLLALLSVLGFAYNNAISYWAMQYTEALNALLIQSACPLFVAVWSLLLFGVRLTGAQLAGIALSLAGRAHHYPARRLRRAGQHQPQSGRPDVWEFTAGIRAVFGAAATTAGDAHNCR